MSTLRRLDAELVRRHLATSREHAAELIAQGLVTVNGTTASKKHSQINESSSIVVSESIDKKWVSRGAHKLLGALELCEPLGLSLRGKRVVDAGASTGGFTEVCLDREALSVLAIDVGYGQLAWKLRTDDRVLVVERTNIRHVVVDDMPFKPDVIVSDLSFISLTIVVEKFREMSHESTDWLLMVKPQFEVGKDLIGDGVVRDAGLRGGAVEKVALSIQELGVGIVAIAPSPLPGPEGNVEYFIWAKCGAPLVDSEHLNRLILEAIEKGPQ